MSISIPVLDLRKFMPPDDVFHLQNDMRTSQWGVPYHTHRFAEVFWIFQGRARHHVNGTTVDLEAGNVVFIRPTDKHSLETMPQVPLGLVNIAFASKELSPLRRRYFKRDASWPWKEGPLPQVRQLEKARLVRIQEWAEGLAHFPRSAFALDRFLLNLLHTVAAGVSEEPLPPEMPDWLARACKGIREKEAMREGVKSWVRLCGRSPEHVSRTTRHWLGLSPTDYVNQTRLAHLERELRISSQPIIDLALDAGFPTLGHMYKMFKARYGLPPLQYRQHHRKVLV